MREQLRIHDHALQAQIVHVLIDRLNALQRRLCGNGNPASQYPNAWHVDLRRVVAGRWADELHPTDAGFGAVAGQFAATLRQALPDGAHEGTHKHAPLGALEQERTPNLGDDAEAALADAQDMTEAVADWRVATCLTALRDKINALAPRRSRAADGTIGDAMHRTRSSDHNPWVEDGRLGVVTAIDITDDPGKGCSAKSWPARCRPCATRASSTSSGTAAS